MDTQYQCRTPKQRLIRDLLILRRYNDSQVAYEHRSLIQTITPPLATVPGPSPDRCALYIPAFLMGSSTTLQFIVISRRPYLL